MLKGKDLFENFLSLEEKTPYNQRSILYWQAGLDVHAALLIDEFYSIFYRKIPDITPIVRIRLAKRRKQLEKLSDYISKQVEHHPLPQPDC